MRKAIKIPKTVRPSKVKRFLIGFSFIPAVAVITGLVICVGNWLSANTGKYFEAIALGMILFMASILFGFVFADDSEDDSY